MGMNDLFDRVLDMLDSPLRDEFIERYKKRIKLYHPKWQKTKNDIDVVGHNKDYDNNATRQISYQPVENDAILTGNKQSYSSSVMGMPVNVTENIDLEKKDDEINCLLDELEENNAYYLVKPYIMPITSFKQFLFESFGSVALDCVEAFIGPKIDKATKSVNFAKGIEVNAERDIDFAKQKEIDMCHEKQEKALELHQRLETLEIRRDPIKRKEIEREIKNLLKDPINFKLVFDVFIRNPLEAYANE